MKLVFRLLLLLIAYAVFCEFGIKAAIGVIVVAVAFRFFHKIF